MAIGTSIIVRMALDKACVTFGQVIADVSLAGGDVVAIDVISANKQQMVRDLTIQVHEGDGETVVRTLRSRAGVRILHVSDRTFLVHLGGKLSIEPKIRIQNREDLSRVYTPGVARVCEAIASDPSKVYALTMKRNTVAIVTDGTAVLGLGNIGPLAALPVMEGKAMLFKQLAGVDAFPICLHTTDVEAIVETIQRIAPTFGGINLEDIAAPQCFEIEQRLRHTLDIPVFHDDQHGTAVVLLAGLLNALAVVQKEMAHITVVLVGCGAAGTACAHMLLKAGVGELICVDQGGALVSGETYNTPHWDTLAAVTNHRKKRGTLSDVIVGADVFIGVSRGGVLTVADIQQMASDPIVFAMANPEPEISPEVAEPHVRILATGRSDYPNQLNNVLCFPGMFRGVLDCRASEINDEMKYAAAVAIAEIVPPDQRHESYIIPSIFNDHVATAVAEAVVGAAVKTGVARRRLRIGG